MKHVDPLQRQKRKKKEKKSGRERERVGERRLTVATLCYFATTVKPVNYDHLRDWEIVVSGGARFG